jgi:hypothetical protein
MEDPAIDGTSEVGFELVLAPRPWFGADLNFGLRLRASAIGDIRSSQSARAVAPKTNDNDHDSQLSRPKDIS